MTRTVKIRLRWLPEGSSSPLLAGQSLARPARFDHQSDVEWLRNAWTLVVEVAGAPDAQGYQTGSAKFLVPNAPNDWLSEGSKFTLHDGKQAFAAGEVETVISP